MDDWLELKRHKWQMLKHTSLAGAETLEVAEDGSQKWRTFSLYVYMDNVISFPEYLLDI